MKLRPCIIAKGFCKLILASKAHSILKIMVNSRLFPFTVITNTKQTYSTHKQLYNSSLEPFVFTIWVESIWLSICLFFLFFNTEWKPSFFMAVSESTELIDLSSDNNMIWNPHNKGLSLYCVLNMSKYFPGHDMKIDVFCFPLF